MLSSAVVMRDPSPAACCPAVAVDVSAFILHLTTLYVFCFVFILYYVAAPRSVGPCCFCSAHSRTQLVPSVPDSKERRWRSLCQPSLPFLLKFTLRGIENKEKKIFFFTSPFIFTQINWQERVGLALKQNSVASKIPNKSIKTFKDESASCVFLQEKKTLPSSDGRGAFSFYFFYLLYNIYVYTLLKEIFFSNRLALTELAV